MVRLFLLFSLSVLCGCVSGVTVVERSEKLPEDSRQLTTADILFLEPEARQLEVVNSVKQNYSSTAKLQKQFTQYLRRSSRKNKVKANIVSISELAGNDMQKFADLTALRDHVLLANSQQGQSPDAQRVYSGLYERLMASSPQLFPEFSSLQSLTGTPYIAFTGWSNIDGRNITNKGRAIAPEGYNRRTQSNIFYMIVINLETSEVIYREIKRVSGSVNQTVLMTSLYDSFFIFRKHIGRS